MERTLNLQPIRLLLLDPNVPFRQSLGRFLVSRTDIRVIGECGTPADALRLLARDPVDVTLADQGCAREMAGRVLVLADSVDGRQAAEALSRGASGIFLKSKSLDRLVDAIRLVALGETWVDESIVRLLAQSYPRPITFIKPLTSSEQQVLEGLVQGLTSRRIGTQTGRSEAAVKAILQQLFAKAGVRSRSQLVRIAIESGLQATESYG